PRRVARRAPSARGPGVVAIEPRGARLGVVGLACRDGWREDLEDARQILWMNGSVRAPLPHGVLRLAAVGDELVVDQVDFARRSQDGDQARKGVHDQARLALAFAESLLRPLALDELTDLAAQGRHRVEQALVGLADLTAEEVDDAEDLAGEEDRKGEGRVQPFARGDARPHEGGVPEDIGNACRRAARPHRSRQPAAPWKRARASEGLELRGLEGRPTPHLRAE